MKKTCFQLTRDPIFVKGYGFLSFAKNIGKNLSGKYNEKQLDHAKNYATDTVKATSKRVIKKEQKQLVIWLVMTKN